MDDFDPFALYDAYNDEGGVDDNSKGKPKKGQYLLRVKLQEVSMMAATGNFDF